MSKVRLTSKAHFFRDLDMSSILVSDAPPAGSLVTAGTKIVCTIGPSCCEVEALCQLLRSGMSIARIDLTWGPLDFHIKSLENLQLALKKERRMCAIMIDTLGREIMVRRQYHLENGWPMHDATFNITAGSTVTISTRPEAEASETVLPVTYEKFPQMVAKGDTVYIGRYLVSGADRASLYMEVLEVSATEVVCVAKNDAELDGLMTIYHSERSGDTLDNVQNDLPFLSDYDKNSLVAIAERFEIDLLSTSYTRSADDIVEARRFMASIGAHEARMVAKLESRQSLFNFQGILAEADGIIISRGNLGLDMPPEKMAHVQKTLISACNLVGKPVIITRVVDTMVNTPRPTRAEATDIANAVLDGVDGFLLGAETLRGNYPTETVDTIIRICHTAEGVFDHSRHHDHLAEIAAAAEEALADWIEADSEDGGEAHSGANSPPGELQQGGHHSGVSRSSSGVNTAGGGGVGVHFAEEAVSSPRSSATGGALPHGLGGHRMGGQFGSNNSLSSYSGNGGRTMGGSTSYASLSNAMRGLARGMKRSRGSLQQLGRQQAVALTHVADPYLMKLESIASSAVRAAERVGAALIVVYTTSGKTAQLVAKYRPPMPIMTLVVPHLVSDGLKWSLQGKSAARQCMMVRGLLPVLATPSPSGDALLEETIAMAGRMGVVEANDYVVVVQRLNHDFCVKILAVNEEGCGIKQQPSLDVISTRVPGTKPTHLVAPPSPVLGKTTLVAFANPYEPTAAAPEASLFVPTLSSRA